ncbi:MAG: hypothetical protein JGK04_08435 [Microcoleus sp. PH2017_39_LGB_O_B]|uniref:hypothetical protein n=1 Tax=unclassified Microcoleus TaxID=2642155 RepID=UPI001DBF6185|nr:MULTISPECIES: hypothetical protein [unclassified Microcoleus]MCC3447465.1 hypothetical protein [Microcoleus sp. PH2017_09_SFU_O_A]MCC3628461.1 hypothetical protein [Microcoleus sp. PH2017_39_LGB_O_B]MCC3640536.1 hypothetical protein [Microcoleus sp. PH2017_33_LGB_O_A]TAF91319.1 MAG: hypothetical protein EAZ49_06140 [Oscillatoriales cyanobacterium]
MKRSRSINLDKDSSRRPTEQIDMGSKPTQLTPEVGSLGVSGTRELGSYGGISAVGDAAAGIAELGAPGVSININPAEQSAKAEVDLGIKQGFGVSFGGEIKRTPTGVSVENVSFGVNVLGFGVNAEGNGSESSKLGVSALGFKIEVANDKDGKTSIRLGYEIPGARGGVTFAPDGEKAIIEKPIELDTSKPDSISTVPMPTFKKGARYWEWTYVEGWYEPTFRYNPQTGKRELVAYYRKRESPYPQSLITVGNCFGEDSFTPTLSGEAEVFFRTASEGTDDPSKALQRFERSSVYNVYCANSHTGWMYTQLVSKYYMRAETDQDWTLVSITIKQIREYDAVPTQQQVPQNLPNYPQRYKPMNCCDKVEEIYKYLGIAKMKKKFKVAKQFLVPGGNGNEECEDYYALCEALFRMLANGLIINPVSKPLGSEWKNVNATAWASGVYEMVAESMSNGDTTQKYEISSIMQQVQMMSAIAELSRKVDFLSEAIGMTPDLDTEELPVCFTIHEAHKGFGKKQPKQIDISKPKTDNEVEKVLGTMLQPSKIPIVKWVFRPESISIAAALSKL